MSLACEAEVHVQNENALRFSIVCKPVPLLEYIKTISSLVGASHILAIFEETESLKVFFDDKRYVDALIRSGIHVVGHHVKIDYVVPPGTKVVLNNVDPVITNIDIVKLLSAYGSVVSPVIRPPISDDTELCHIGYGVRYVYMILNGSIPSKIDFKYGEQLYTVKARIDERPVMIAIPFIKTDDSDSTCDDTNTVSSFDALPLPGPSGIENGPAPIVVNVDNEQNSMLQIESSVSLKVRGRRSRSRKPRKECFVRRRKRATPTSQAARRIKRTAKQKFMSVRKNHLRKVKNHPSEKQHNPLDITEVVNEVSNSIPDPMAPVICDDKNISEVAENNSNVPYKPILDMQKLLMFLDEVKGHRAPVELAKKYIGDSYTSNSIHILCQQLRLYNASHTDINLKTRVLRLIKTLKEALKDSL